MARILRRPRAQRDIFELWDYIAVQSGEDRADSFIDRIDQAIHTLAEHPEFGRPRDELKLGLRSFPVGRYLVLYYPLPDGIAVSRILYGGRDLLNTLNDDD